MAKPRTWFERRKLQRMKDPEFAAAYTEAKAEIDAVDALVRELDDERKRQGLSKAELARRSGLPAISVRRLLTIDEPDPKVSTLMTLSRTLGRPLGLPPSPGVVVGHRLAAQYKAAKKSKPAIVMHAVQPPRSRRVSKPRATARKGGSTPTGAAT